MNTLEIFLINTLIGFLKENINLIDRINRLWI